MRLAGRGVGRGTVWMVVGLLVGHLLRTLGDELKANACGGGGDC